MVVLRLSGGRECWQHGFQSFPITWCPSGPDSVWMFLAGTGGRSAVSLVLGEGIDDTAGQPTALWGCSKILIVTLRCWGSWVCICSQGKKWDLTWFCDLLFYYDKACIT
jgi:hypothetical protein